MYCEYLRVLSVITVIAFGHVSESDASDYEAVKFAYGVITATMLKFVAYSEGCEKTYPKLSPDLKDALHNWGVRNKILDSVRDGFFLRALPERS